MIFMSKHIFWRSGNSMDTFFKIVSMMAILKSKMAALELLILFIFEKNITGKFSTVKWK